MWHIFVLVMFFWRYSAESGTNIAKAGKHHSADDQSRRTSKTAQTSQVLLGLI